jgi:hypothetical protein
MPMPEFGYNPLRPAPNQSALRPFHSTPDRFDPLIRLPRLVPFRWNGRPPQEFCFVRKNQHDQ